MEPAKDTMSDERKARGNAREASGEEGPGDHSLSSPSCLPCGSLAATIPLLVLLQTEADEETIPREGMPCGGENCVADESAPQVDLELSLSLPYYRDNSVEAPAHLPTHQTASIPSIPREGMPCRGEHCAADESAPQVDLELSLSLPYYRDISVEAPARLPTHQTVSVPSIAPVLADEETIRKTSESGAADVNVASAEGHMDFYSSSSAYGKYSSSAGVRGKAGVVIRPRKAYARARPPLAVHLPKPPPKGMAKKGVELERPPFPWATNRRAMVHSLSHLLSQGITSISGEVVCAGCGAQSRVSYDLQSKFEEVGRFIIERGPLMHDRAPAEWLRPAQPDCKSCNMKEALTPVISPKKRNINWLFLFLGQGIGFCTLKQLKYFCKHTKNHRTGAKDRLLYMAYMHLHQQLLPPT